MTLTQYIESKERELAHYVREREFQANNSGPHSMVLWLIATSRIDFLEREIAELERLAEIAVRAAVKREAPLPIIKSPTTPTK